LEPNHGEMESYDDGYALKTHQEFGDKLAYKVKNKKEKKMKFYIQY
jgi:hypothetical protein